MNYHHHVCFGGQWPEKYGKWSTFSSLMLSTKKVGAEQKFSVGWGLEEDLCLFYIKGQTNLLVCPGKVIKTAL